MPPPRILADQFSLYQLGGKIVPTSLLLVTRLQGTFRLYFELFEKICRGRHHLEISKTNTIFTMDSPPETPGVSKNAPLSDKQAHGGLVQKNEFELQKVQITVRKQAFLTFEGKNSTKLQFFDTPGGVSIKIWIALESHLAVFSRIFRPSAGFV